MRRQKRTYPRSDLAVAMALRLAAARYSESALISAKAFVEAMEQAGGESFAEIYRETYGVGLKEEAAKCSGLGGKEEWACWLRLVIRIALVYRYGAVNPPKFIGYSSPIEEDDFDEEPQDELADETQNELADKPQEE
jgi:hypothetical protein